MPLDDLEQEQADSRQVIREAFKTVEGQTVALKKRRNYIFPLQKDKNAWLVETGHIMVMRGSPSGHYQGFSILGAGDILGISIFGGTRREIVVFPLNAAKLYCIHIDDFQRLLETDHRFCLAMYQYACSRLSSLLDQYENSSFLSVEERLEALEAKIQKLPSLGEPFTLSQTSAAWAVGTHPVSVCRAMKGKKITFRKP